MGWVVGDHPVDLELVESRYGSISVEKEVERMRSRYCRCCPKEISRWGEERCFACCAVVDVTSVARKMGLIRSERGKRVDEVD